MLCYQFHCEPIPCIWLGTGVQTCADSHTWGKGGREGGIINLHCEPRPHFRGHGVQCLERHQRVQSNNNLMLVWEKKNWSRNVSSSKVGLLLKRVHQPVIFRLADSHFFFCFVGVQEIKFVGASPPPARYWTANWPLEKQESEEGVDVLNESSSLYFWWVQVFIVAIFE